LVEERIPDFVRISMRLMYGSKEGRFAVDHMHIKKILSGLTNEQGKKYDHPHSKKQIEPFIHFHQLNIQEILDPLESFQNFNQFFYRKLKASARPIAEPGNSKVCVSPGDCRLNVFSSLDDATKLWIKGKKFNLGQLMGDEKLAQQYYGGSLAICRLAPQDYHRFHCPVDGTFKIFKQFPGAYYTVNPIAINAPVDVYTENKRTVTIIESPQFDQVIFVAVGATMVGSIVFTAKTGQQVKHGEELGYFAFGGSTVLLLFKPGTIKFDADLLVNSEKPIETLVKMGNSLGISTK